MNLTLLNTSSELEIALIAIISIVYFVILSGSTDRINELLLQRNKKICAAKKFHTICDIGRENKLVSNQKRKSIFMLSIIPVLQLLVYVALFQSEFRAGHVLLTVVSYSFFIGTAMLLFYVKSSRLDKKNYLSFA